MIQFAKWIRNKTSDRAAAVAKLLLKLAALQEKEKELEANPDHKGWFGTSNHKKLKKIDEKKKKINKKLSHLEMEVLRNPKLYEKDHDDNKHNEVFYDRLTTLLAKKVSQSKVEELIALFKKTVD